MSDEGTGDRLQLGRESRPGLPDVSPSREDLLDRLVHIEEARIERDNRQIDIQQQALLLGNEQDQRQATTYTEQMRLHDAADQRRVGLVGRIVWIGSALISLPLAVLLFMAFWGDETQRHTALTVLEIGLIGIAGYGVLRALGSVVRVLTRQSREG